MTDASEPIANCIDCGYTLRGLTEPICPECGRAFDPKDASTIDIPGMSPSWRAFARPPGFWHHAIMAGFTVAYVIYSSEPGGLAAAFGFGWKFLAFPCAITYGFMLLTYVVLAANAIQDRSRAGSDRGVRYREHWLCWIVTPLCLAILLSARWAWWPVCARFALSRAEFEDTVRLIESGADPSTLRGRIGYFEILDLQWDESGEVFLKTGVSGSSQVGFIYLTAGYFDDDSHIRLADRWYADMH